MQDKGLVTWAWQLGEAPELEVRWGLRWVLHLEVILTLVLLFTQVSFTLLSHRSHWVGPRGA